MWTRNDHSSHHHSTHLQFTGKETEVQTFVCRKALGSAHLERQTPLLQKTISE